MKRLNQKGFGVGIIIAIVAAVALAGAGFYAYQNNKSANEYGPGSGNGVGMGNGMGDGSGTGDRQQLRDGSGDGQQNGMMGNEDNYSGTMQKMMQLGIPLKCTYSVDGNEFEGYMKGSRFRGNVENADGTRGGIAMKANCMYAWNEGDVQGFKLCLDDVESFVDEAAWDELDSSNAGMGASANRNYNCRPAIVTDAELEPPSGVDFMTMDELMDSMMQDQ